MQVGTTDRTEAAGLALSDMNDWTSESTADVEAHWQAMRAVEHEEQRANQLEDAERDARIAAALDIGSAARAAR